MSAIPNKVILLEPGLAPIVIELPLNRGGRLSWCVGPGPFTTQDDGQQQPSGSPRVAGDYCIDSLFRLIGTLIMAVACVTATRCYLLAILVRVMKSVALLAAVWIGLNALCVWLVANNKMQGWDLYAILFALVLAIAVSIVIVWR